MICAEKITHPQCNYNFIIVTMSENDLKKLKSEKKDENDILNYFGVLKITYLLIEKKKEFSIYQAYLITSFCLFEKLENIKNEKMNEFQNKEKRKIIRIQFNVISKCKNTPNETIKNKIYYTNHLKNNNTEAIFNNASNIYTWYENDLKNYNKPFFD